MISRVLSTVGALCLALACTAGSLPAAQAAPPTIDGAWTLNREASDRPGPDGADDQPDGRGGRGGRGGPGGRGGRGGFGGGFGRGRAGGPGGRGGMDREAMERRLEAMRAIVRPAERLTITRTPSMVIVTNDEGSTTRLAPDGSRVKDESTGIERRSRWDGATLVTEITGVQGGRITETYAADPTTGQLIVTLQLPPRRNSDEKVGQTLRRVYEPQR